MQINRRQAVIGGCVTLVGTKPILSNPVKDQASDLAAKLPRWRGFNLQEKYILHTNSPYEEWDFQFCADHGFDYIRLPLDYRIWTKPDGGWREAPLKEIDQAVEFGRRYHAHISLCLHRAPGYCINPPKEDRDLWMDRTAQQQFADQWRMFAARYRGIPSEQLSFNLINEPPDISEDMYAKVIRLAVEAIRAEDPTRLIIADGRNGGRKPTFSLADLHIAQTTRGYEPFHLTHYRAPWVQQSLKWTAPTWPYRDGISKTDADTLWQEQIVPWQKLEQLDVGIMVGEWGAYNQTPHHIVLAWMKDCLANWRKAGWGWCLWNLRGDFGPIDSGRWDVRYTDLSGYKLDPRMLEILQAS